MVLLGVLILVALITIVVSIVKGVDSGVASREFQEDGVYQDGFANSRKSKRVVGDFIEPLPSTHYEDDFDHLMRPGSSSSAWFNTADEEGYEPEDW